MATYQNISKNEMENFLVPLGFRQITLSNTKEIVYAKRLTHTLQLSLRVYTGINPDGNSRESGSDAIRVNLFWRNNLGEIKNAGGSKRVHRVLGWKANLKNRLDNWDQDFITCPNCGAPMVERENKAKGSKFLGCCNYPICKTTKPLVDERVAQKHAYQNTPINFNASNKIGDKVKLNVGDCDQKGTILARYRIKQHPKLPSSINNTNGYLILLDNQYFNPVIQNNTMGIPLVEPVLEKI